MGYLIRVNCLFKNEKDKTVYHGLKAVAMICLLSSLM